LGLDDPNNLAPYESFVNFLLSQTSASGAPAPTAITQQEVLGFALPILASFSNQQLSYEARYRDAASGITYRSSAFIQPISMSVVPIPASLVLLLSGFGLLAGLSRRASALFRAVRYQLRWPAGPAVA
jgi:hypothetical protein